MYILWFIIYIDAFQKYTLTMLTHYIQTVERQDRLHIRSII